MQLLNEHVDEEENTIIPAFANAVSAEELQQMGERFEECKKHLPTRYVVNFQCLHLG